MIALDPSPFLQFVQVPNHARIGAEAGILRDFLQGRREAVLARITADKGKNGFAAIVT